MINLMKPLAASFLMLLASVAMAQDASGPSTPQSEQRAFSKVPRTGEEKLRSFFMFSASGHDYTIRIDGRGESVFGKGRPHDFSLKTDRGRLEQVYFCELETDLLLLYELSNEGNGWGYLMRLNQTTVKARWIAPISAFDLGPALVDGSSLYLTAASLVAKLDLNTGAYAWQQGDLLAKYAPSFQVFRPPWIKGDHVFFKEGRAPYKSLEVDKLTGKIINILE